MLEASPRRRRLRDLHDRGSTGRPQAAQQILRAIGADANFPRVVSLAGKDDQIAVELIAARSGMIINPHFPQSCTDRVDEIQGG